MDEKFMLTGLIVLAAITTVLLVVLTVLVVKLAKREVRARKNATSPAPSEQGRRADGVVVSGGVRYTESEVIEDGGGAKVTHREGDILLAAGETKRAGRDMLPGRYTLLATGSDTRFNVRLGGYVREMKHGDPVVLIDGDEICAVSHAVILR